MQVEVKTPDLAEANQINNQAYAALKDTYIKMKQDHRVPENGVEEEGNPYIQSMEDKVSSYWYHADHTSGTLSTGLESSCAHM